MSEAPPNYCSHCGAEVWPLKGTDALTCRRGHHQPNHWREHYDALKRVTTEMKRQTDLASVLLEHDRAMRSKFHADLLSGQFRKRTD